MINNPQNVKLLCFYWAGYVKIIIFVIEKKEVDYG